MMVGTAGVAGVRYTLYDAQSRQVSRLRPRSSAKPNPLENSTFSSGIKFSEPTREGPPKIPTDVRSIRGLRILSKDPQMPRGDSQERDCGSFRLPSALLPVAQGMNADCDRSGELSLSQPDEASQRRDVYSGLEASLHQPSPQARGNRSLELFVGQFGDIRHLYRSMCERYRICSRLLASRAPRIRTRPSSRSVETTTTSPRSMGPMASLRIPNAPHRRSRDSDTRLKELLDLREGQTVLSLVADVLRRIPLELH